MNNAFEVIRQFESKYEIEVPPIIKLFYGMGYIDNLFPEYLNLKYDFKFPLIKYYEIPNTNKIKDKLTIHSFIKTNELQESLNRFIEMWGSLKDFFPISFEVMPISAWILVGVNKANYGQIWLTNEAGGSDLTLLFSSLTELLLDCRIEWFEEEIKEIGGLNQLQKNWGEDFWRIKK